MLGMSFDQLHRCDTSPLATGLGKNKLLQSNAAELPSLGTPGHCPDRDAPLHRSGMPKTQLCLCGASSSLKNTGTAFAQWGHLDGHPRTPTSPLCWHLPSPATTDLGLQGESITPSSESMPWAALRAEPLWADHRGGQGPSPLPGSEVAAAIKELPVGTGPHLLQLSLFPPFALPAALGEE